MSPNASVIFLSYRREDSNPATHGIHARLEESFGRESVFRDTATIEGGDEVLRVPIVASNSRAGGDGAAALQ